MAVDNSGLLALEAKVRALKKDMPNIIDGLILGEGIYAVKQAKSIAKNDNPDAINTGHYRNNFHAGNTGTAHSNNDNHDGTKPRRTGGGSQIDVYNNLDYAGHVEEGFRSHFVPGHWSGKQFVYQPNDPAGGMYVGKPGSYVRGRWILKRAIYRTRQTQNARLKRKLDKIVKERLGSDG